MIKAPLPEQEAELKRRDARLAEAIAAFARLEPELAQAQQAWERSLPGQAIQWQPSQGLLAHYPLDGSLAAPVAITTRRQAGGRGERAERPGPLRVRQDRRAASFDGKASSRVRT